MFGSPGMLHGTCMPKGGYDVFIFVAGRSLTVGLTYRTSLLQAGFNSCEDLASWQRGFHAPRQDHQPRTALVKDQATKCPWAKWPPQPRAHRVMMSRNGSVAVGVLDCV